MFCFSFAEAQKKDTSISHKKNFRVLEMDTSIYYMKSFYVSETTVLEQPVRIIDKDSSDFLRVLLPDNIEDIYTVQDYFKNGKLKMTAKSLSRDYYPKLSGACIEFFPNGKRKSIKTYQDGKPLGDAFEYFPNGKPYLTGNYNKDGKFIISSCNDSTGKVLVENGNGHCIRYDYNFKQIYAEGNIVDGLEEGEWHGMLDDSANYMCNYEKGVSKGGVTYDKSGKRYTFTTGIIEPQFKGGTEEFYKFLAKNIKYPIAAKENNIHGKIILGFVIEKDGTLTNVKVLQGIGGGCDEEAVRVIKISPPWLPGVQYGIPVCVPYTVPITFTVTIDKN